ncbi:YheC/YheD family protein [Chengkuizengella axinellae]|uniref:YheC/YheD family protein n=1 Tax=Chengkuizengella axinellae TaxID=3064388 RepID=A0ABT9J5X0_9BACL|nr:YheC/YheD family protein [Chengkuizengella sp. 2205SS18-9]MDP5276995.1 YheC/YheD family protein [Chengkuizengella sp. 2205SS18-9]
MNLSFFSEGLKNFNQNKKSLLSNKKIVVGVFVRENFIKKLMKQDSDFKMYFMFNEFYKASEDTDTTLYFFGCHDIDFDRRKIVGTFREKGREWSNKEFPFPDVIFDRVHNSNQSAEIAREKFKELNIKTMNPKSYFDKKELLEELLKFKSLEPYIPRTAPFNGYDDLEKILIEEKSIYLKDIYGRAGIRIMKIKKIKKKGYRYQYSLNKKIHKGMEKNLKKLYQKILKLYKGKENQVYIQTAINLLRVENKIVDMRAEVQRDRNGGLVILAVPVRIAQKGAHITTHSEAVSFQTFFRDQLNYSEQEINKLKNQIDHFLREVYMKTEQIYGSFGQLGIDFALDKNKKLWFIECNAKSAQVSILKAYGENMVQESFKNNLGYAKFLVDSN